MKYKGRYNYVRKPEQIKDGIFEQMLRNDSRGDGDSPRLLHGSPLYVVINTLCSLQPFSQHGSGVVHIMVCRRPETQTQTTQNVIKMKQTLHHLSQ